MLNKESVFLKVFRFSLHVNRRHSQRIRDLIYCHRAVSYAISNILRECRAEKVFRRRRTAVAVNPDIMKLYRVEFKFACCSHGIHTFLKIFFGFEQMPLDSADGKSKLGCYRILSFILKIIRNYDLPLQFREICYLRMQPRYGFPIDKVGHNVLVRRKNVRQLVHRNTDAASASVAVVICKRIVSDLPDKFVG